MTATGYGVSGDFGIRAGTSGNKNVNIHSGNVTASGSAYAIEGTVKNRITGIGWPNTGGTGDGTAIPASETGGSLQYNKVWFHSHSFTYTGAGATITVTCSNPDCPLHDGKTMTIVEPTLKTYGQTGEDISASATLSDLNAFNAATGLTIAETDIKYVGRDGTSYSESDTAPTGAGKYTAKITVEGKTASVDYEIAKANPKAEAPTGLTATYGQKLADVSLDGKNPEGNTPGTWSWTNTSTSVGTVGNHTFPATFTPTDTANYKTVSDIPVTVTVNRAANPALVNQYAVVKIGNKVDLADNIKLNGATGTDSYAISGEVSGCSLTDSVLTSGNSTGTVTVKVTIAQDGNYEELADTTITVTITDKETQTITAEDVTFAVGDTGKSVSASTDGDGTISYVVKAGSEDYIDVDPSTGALTIKKAGTAIVVVTAAETVNYAMAKKEVTVKIAEAPITAIDGNGFVWHKGSSENSTIRFSSNTDSDLASVETLISVSVDGTALTKDKEYKASNGSVKIEFTKSYLETLSVGAHNVVAKFSSYSCDVNATFTVAAKSSGGGSTPKKDNVVTCQMAGYPANYAWNEAAKACQPGYLDANGVFHSTTRAGVPNTYDKGIMGSLISLVTASVIAFAASLLLRITDR